ncbi:hypothetical protein J4714_01630 [Staphylococcus epidermidis]|nr:hypothetical protein [Staphylococcus epidermidis]
MFKNEREVNKMSGISKFISAIVVLLLLIGLAFGIYSFVDSSKKATNDSVIKQHSKKRKRR